MSTEQAARADAADFLAGKWLVDIWEFPQANPPRQEVVVCSEQVRLAQIMHGDDDNPFTLTIDQAKQAGKIMAAGPELVERLDALQRIADKALGVLNDNGIAVKVAHELVREIAAANHAILKVKAPDTPKTGVAALAAAFAAAIVDSMMPSELEGVNAKNKRNGYADAVCATHDYCDANQAMLDALENLNIEYDPNSQSQVDLVNGAWAMAKRADFDVSSL